MTSDMTREEAEDYIREWCPYDKHEDIIKALEQEPKTEKAETQGDDRWLLHFGQNMAIPSAELCENAVSRKAVEYLLAYYVNEDKYVDAVKDLRKLLPVQPKQSFKGMTNGEVINSLFSKGTCKFMKIHMADWWWNSPYKEG